MTAAVAPTPYAMFRNDNVQSAEYVSLAQLWSDLVNYSGANGLLANGVYMVPSFFTVQAGNATNAAIRESGNINFQSGSFANTAVISDIVLFAYTLPANALDAIGRMLTITACGVFGATANNKNVKLWWNATTAIVGSAITGGTVIATTGVQTSNALGWQVFADVWKTGSSTQLAQGQNMYGTTHGGVNPPVSLTATDTGAIIIALTGASSTTGAANDVVGNMLQIDFFN
jgi:hypothetical protein